MTQQTDLLKAFNILYSALEEICNNAEPGSLMEQQAGAALYRASKVLLAQPKSVSKLTVQVSPGLVKSGLENLEVQKTLKDKPKKLRIVV